MNMKDTIQNESSHPDGNEGDTPLIRAIRVGDVKATKKLIAKGVDVNVKIDNDIDNGILQRYDMIFYGKFVTLLDVLDGMNIENYDEIRQFLISKGAVSGKN